MIREFVWTSAFQKGWRNCEMDDDDLAELEKQLLDDPKAGDVIKGTGGARKFRFAYEDRGKSGSTRIIYVDFEVGEKICGLAAYPKSKKDSLSNEEKAAIRKMIGVIEPYYNRKD